MQPICSMCCRIEPSSMAFKQLEPGHYLLAGQGEHCTVKYWDLDYPLDEDECASIDEEQAIEEFGRLFAEAVRVCGCAPTPLSAAT